MLENYEKAFEINPNLAEAHLGLGWAHFYKEDLAKALSNTSSNDELMKLSEDLDALVKTVESKTERWMELAQWVD
jgi:hypothetical protein